MRDVTGDGRPQRDQGAPTTATIKDRAAHGAFWTIIHVVVTVPLAFVGNAVVARVLGTEDYGRLAFLTLLVLVLTMLTDAGTTDATIQWGAASYAKGETQRVRLLLRRSLGFHLFVQLPVLILVVLVVSWGTGWVVALVLVVSVVVPVCMSSVTATVTIENRSAPAAQIAMVAGLVTQIVATGVALVFQTAASVWAARAVVPAVLTPLNLRLLPSDWRRNALRVAVPRGFPVGYWKFSLVSGVSGLVGTLVYARSEVFVLQTYDALAAAGLFALAAGIAGHVTAPVSALINPLRPAVAGVVETHPHRVASSILRVTRVSSVLAALVAATAVPALFGLIPVIYGEAFRDAAPAFFVLALLSCLQTAIAPLKTFTAARKAAGTLLRLNIVALSVDAAVAFATVPFIGLWGAVLANAAGQCVALLTIVVIECRTWRVPIMDFIRAASSFLVLVPFLLAAAVSSRLWEVSGLLGAVASVIGGGAVVIIAARGVGGFSSPDADFLVRSLPARLRPIGSVVIRLFTFARPGPVA